MEWECALAENIGSAKKFMKSNWITRDLPDRTPMRKTSALTPALNKQDTMRTFVMICVTIGWMTVFLFVGCDNKDPLNTQYGIACNPLRSQHGIRLLETNWHFQSVRSNQLLIWTNPKWSSGTPGYVNKTLELQGTQIVTETDTYVSGATVPASDPDRTTDLQSLAIEYHYPAKQGDLGKWECRLGINTGITNISLDIATNLIRQWGIK